MPKLPHICIFIIDITDLTQMLILSQSQIMLFLSGEHTQTIRVLTQYAQIPQISVLTTRFGANWLEIKGLQMRQFYWLWGMSSTEVLENIMAWRFSLKITICHGTKAASSNQQRSFIFHWKTTWNNFDEQVVVSCSSTRSSSSLLVNVQSPLRDKS